MNGGQCAHVIACTVSRGLLDSKCPITSRKCCTWYEPEIDRDALLALADDIDKQTDGSMFDAWLEDGHYIARRIREAVGS